MSNESKPEVTDGRRSLRDVVGRTSLILTAEEIRDLAEFCGMVLQQPTAAEKADERETEIVIVPWPKEGVKDDEGGDFGMLPPHKHIAYYEEYPEEGCIPLGSPNDSNSATPARP